MTNRPSVLFIDQEQSIIRDMLEATDYSSKTNVSFATSKSDLTPILQNQLDIIFIDVSFIDQNTGLLLFKKLIASHKALIIAVVPEEDSQTISTILDLNPFFYITKPYNAAEVKLALRRAVEKINHARQLAQVQSVKNEFCGIIGKSTIMTDLFNLISRVAEDDFSTVMIRGESGTGKELVAKAIHTKSKRKVKNFVAVNCAAIPDDLLESELFGHTKGAFTGATQNKQGRIQYADGGTLFLDEIGDMKPNLQAKLLRVLQEKEFEPIGGLQPTPVDTRILAATHCNLEDLVKEGKFREDLYYRLSVIPLNIPPLKSRREDIPLLMESFINTYTIERGRERFMFSPQAIDILLQYNWRGNVRELENLIQHMSVLFAGKKVEVEDLPEKYLLEENQSPDSMQHLTSELASRETEDDFDIPVSFEETLPADREIDFKEVINDFETKLIIQAMRASGGNKKEAARLLNLKRTTLLEKIKKKNISSDNW